MMTLIDALKTIPDPRRGAGQRYPLWVLLVLMVLGTRASPHFVRSGYRGFRSLSRFMERHAATLPPQLGLRRMALPSYSTIRRLFHELDFEQVALCLNHWAAESGLTATGVDYALDGKALKSTVVEAHSGLQTFVNVVSALQLHSGTVVGQHSFVNGSTSEIEAVYHLLEQLQFTEATVSLDAMHAQKNHRVVERSGK